MKRLFFLLIPAFLMLFAGCTPEPNVEYDPAMLLGKWVNTSGGTEYWRYDAGNTGVTWDVADDVTETEAQPFDWTLEEGDQLTLVHHAEMGAVVPKIYTITKLTATSLQYEDLFNQTYSFSKVTP